MTTNILYGLAIFQFELTNEFHQCHCLLRKSVAANAEFEAARNRARRGGMVQKYSFWPTFCLFGV